MENIVYLTGKKYLGKDIAKSENELGCAEAVNFVCKEAIGQEAGGGLSTTKMYQSLLIDKRFKRVNTPEKGDIIISPTGYGQGYGHTGIVSDNGKIMSNNSNTYLWDEHLTLGEWWLKYKTFPIAFFRYSDMLNIEQKKISILQKIVELYKQIISLKLKNMKFGALSSSQNPEKLSLTVKALAAALLPIIHLITGVELVNETVDKIIDASFILFINFLALKGYIRAKRAKR